jgi:hypothetical protein
MIRRLGVVCLFILLALLPAMAIAQDDNDDTDIDDEVETGRVFGEVINGTDGGNDVEGLDVVLTRFEQMDAVETWETTVDEDGSYEFDDLPILENEAYLAQVVYEGIEFTSGMVLLTQEAEAERVITVYEQTNDSSVLGIVSRGIVIANADDERGIVEILEIIALENESDQVYVGDEDGQVLRLAMPENAGEIAPQPGFDFGEMYFDETRPNVLVSTGPVQPGDHNPMISYYIPYEGTSASLSVGTAMQTNMLRVLVEEDTYDISSNVLEPAGVQQVGSDNYDVLAIDSPVVGDSFNVEISGLPRENWNLPVEMSTLLASLAAGVGLVIGAVLIYQVVQRRQLATADGAPVASDRSGADIDEMDSDELERERLELASELNKLEADYERGDIDEAQYQSERDGILEELRKISLRMRGLEE